MLTKEAKQIAIDWVEANWERFPGFAGAFFVGSINVSPDEAPWPSTSDVDITILADAPRASDNVAYRGILLGVSTRPNREFNLSPEAVVADFRIAIHFSVPSIIKDPSGALGRIYDYVWGEYPRTKWVVARCQGAEQRAIAVLDGLLDKIGFGLGGTWGAVASLYYATFATAEILALADLRNPTVRKSFVVSRDVLEHFDRLDLQEALLHCLGAASVTEEQVKGHLEELKHAFAYASVVIRTPFFFSADLQMDAEPRVIGGMQQILDMGLHREAAFSIQWTRAVAQRAIETDAPVADKERFRQTYLSQLDDLGLSTKEDRERHMKLVRDLLPRIMEMAEVVMRANPRIQD
jgi:hypothetical protein